MAKKHIVIDARIRRASTGKPVDRLLAYLQDLDTKNRYTVYVAQDDDWQPRKKNFTVITCPYKIFSLNPLQQWRFSRWLKKLNADLVHFTMTGQQPLFYRGKQITFTHDLTMFTYARPGRLPGWLHKLRMMGYSLLMWVAHQRAEITHTPTEYVADAVNKRFLHTNRKTVVTLEASEPPLKAEAKAPETVPSNFLLYVGSAFPHKNLRRLVLSFIQLKEKYPDLQLVLAGKREYHAKQLKKWVKKQPHSGGVVFTGFVDDAELKWLYQNAEAYIFPSLSEGFGLPGLEAMVHGCPVVSSNATCLPEVYGDAAEYFDPENVDDMTRAISKVLKNDKRRKELIAEGKKQANKYSWERMAKQTLEIYQQVLGD